MTKKAFTVLELLFIVVIMGVLSMVASPYFREDKLALATYQTLEHIRYTQHLAMINHRFDPKDANYKINPGNKDSNNHGKYFRSRWQIRFVNQAGTPMIIGYSVYADIDRRGNIDGSAATPTHIEAARNPIDGLLLHNYATCARCSPDTNLYAKFDISDINLSGGCSVVGFTTVNNGKRGTIAFDEKGVPYYGISNNTQNNPYQYLLRSNCIVMLTSKDGRRATISVYPYTGYAEITSLE